MRKKSFVLIMLAITLSVILSSCILPIFDALFNPLPDIPPNHTSVKVYLLPITGSGDRQIIDTAYSSASSAISNGWFIAFDNEFDADLLLEVSTTSFSHSSQRGGSAKHGYYTTYYSDASVAGKLISVDSGLIVSSATNKSSASSSDGYPAYSDAVEDAVNGLIKQLTRKYFGI